MKIAYILSPTCCSPHNGIRIQAEAWQKSLIDIGHNVGFPSLLNLSEFGKYDVIHFFGTGLALLPYINSIYQYNQNIAVSPIIDSYKPIWQYKLAVNTSIPRLRIFSVNGALKNVKPLIKKVFVRSQHEYKYIEKAYGYPTSKIAKVLLAHRMKSSIDPKEFEDKEDYCFHVSTIYQKRKNVIRLIEAAKKFGFKLVLAGDCGSEKQFQPIKSAINNAPNITILGRISEEELVNHYRKARVFALPSLEEGVGQVALEAACYGCNIVITQLGGPKEYFRDKAHIVNPFKIDDIGNKIQEALSEPVNFKLAQYAAEEFSQFSIANQLVNEYNSMLN